MRKDMLHVLLHMARHDHLFTSEQIAEMLQTNPVVVRRTLGGLKKAGYVTAKKGPSGGWSIACDLEKASLLDIYNAVGNPPLFAMGYDHSDPVCAVERVINTALEDTLSQAETLIRNKLSSISLAHLLKDFNERAQADVL